MSYVDAGYAIGLSVLFAYSIGLVLRRRSLERRIELSPSPELDGAAEPGPTSGP